MVAFRTDLSLPTPGLRRHALSLHDLDRGTTTVTALRTNQNLPTVWPLPDAALHAQLSTDGS